MTSPRHCTGTDNNYLTLNKRRRSTTPPPDVPPISKKLTPGSHRNQGITGI
jgi:hypothetical protein